MENTETKVCSKCGNVKIQYIRKNRNSVEYRCVQCCSEYGKKYRKDNIEHMRAKDKKYRLENIWKIKEKMRKRRLEKREMMLFRGAKNRATSNGLDFNITIDDIVIPDVCPILGIPLIVAENSSNDNSPTLDRLDSTKGYVKENICVISYRANRMKSNGTLGEITLICDYMRKNLPIDNAEYCI